MYIIGFSEAGEKRKGMKIYLKKKMAENFFYFVERIRYSDLGILEFQEKRNPKRPTAQHIFVTLSEVKDKKKILKAAREE